SERGALDAYAPDCIARTRRAFAVDDGIVTNPRKTGIFAVTAGYDLGEIEVKRHDQDRHAQAVGADAGEAPRREARRRERVGGIDGLRDALAARGIGFDGEQRRVERNRRPLEARRVLPEHAEPLIATRRAELSIRDRRGERRLRIARERNEPLAPRVD